MAAALRQRAADMLHRGFAWTLVHGQPRNRPALAYRLARPCCRVASDGAFGYECVDGSGGFDPDESLPRGDPAQGGRWVRAYPDPGSYDGGSPGGIETVAHAAWRAALPPGYPNISDASPPPYYAQPVATIDTPA